jgi:hypothetical protein
VAGKITSNRPPVQHYGNHTFRKGDLPAALDRASMPHAPSSPAVDRLMPARNAGTSTTAISTPVRSRSAPATLMMRIRGNGTAGSIRAHIRVNISPPPPRPFDEARADFEHAWQVFQSKRTEADFQAWHDQRDWTARKYAMWEAGKHREIRLSTGRNWGSGRKIRCGLWV